MPTDNNKRKSFIKLLLCLTAFSCQGFAEDKNDAPKSHQDHKLVKKSSQPGYTINFKNVSIKEYLKFISKIADINFIYEDEELDFKVTIVSEEPTNLTNILSALVQELRIHGYGLLDDGVNLIIHKSEEVTQLATVVSEETPYEGEEPPAVVTKLFRIQNANPEKMASIIRPMLSKGALVEVSEETRHVIVTDITGNVDKIADILTSLDAPKSPLEVGSYQIENNSAANLVTLATQIIMPLSEGNPVIMVAQDETKSIFIVSTPFLIDKTLSILNLLDSKPISPAKQKVLSGENVFLYKVQYKSPESIESALKSIASKLESQGYAPEGLLETIDDAQYIDETNSIIFTGSKETLEKIKSLLKEIDSTTKPNPDSENSSFFIYHPKNRSAKELAEVLKNVGQNFLDSGLADQNLINTLEKFQVQDENNALIFSGDKQSIEDLKNLLETIDTPSKESINAKNTKFYIYKIQNAQEEQIAQSLNALADNLEDSNYPDEDLIDAIDSMKWIKETNSLVFSGKKEALDKLSSIIPTFDVLPENAKTVISSNEFLMYTPKHLDEEQILESIKTLTDNLKESGLANPSLIKSLETAKWVPSSKSVVFTGDKKSLARIQDLLGNLDVQEGAAPQKNITFVYRIKHLSANDLEKILDNLSDNLPEGDNERKVIDTMQIADDANSIVFRGPTSAINTIKDFLDTVDTEDEAKHSTSPKSQYVVYKLKHASGSKVINDLESIAKKLKASNLPDNDSLIKSIQSVEWLKGTNSLYITGTQENIKKIQDLVEGFDIQRKEDSTSSYYIYKPENSSAEEIQEQLSSIAEGLQTSGLADPDLINTITTAKYIPTNNTLVFTGTNKSINSIKELVKTLENQSEGRAPIQVFGKRTFFVYKLQYVPGQQLLLNLKNIASDLEYGKTDDKALIETINSGRYIPETNSVIFTGPTEALERIQMLIDKFDIKALAPRQQARSPEGYLVYQPEHVPAQQLINILHEFEQHLIQTGVQEPNLFDTIDNLKFLDQTSSIVITGTDDSTKKVEELLKRFDTPGQAGGQKPDIETIDDLSFLIYKLKYHQGSEIEDALKKIAADLAKTKNSDKNKSLLEAIDSVQWIQVTNSLISTGNPQSLSKLKNLITNIDTPLEQVFIELLVIETDLSNALNFGLRWGTQGKYRNKLGYSTGAFPKFGDGKGTNSDPESNFTTALEKISATNTPTGGAFTQGFNLGVIGDLIYHKGQSYTALGSLLDALRQDGSATIVLSQKVITQNNKPTSLFSGDNIPFTGSTVQNAGNNATVFTSNLEYKDIGVTLNITPRIGDEGLVSLSIDQEISEQLTSDPSDSSAATGGDASGGNISNPSVNGISTSKTTMQTQATVPDDHFLVLSGVVRNTKSKQRSGIPCLGGLPIIGAAFQFTETVVEKRSVIIFVKPQIIKDYNQYKEITEDAEDIARKEGVAEDFDDGLELVKSPDDA